MGHAHHHAPGSGALDIPAPLKRRLALLVAPVILATLVGLVALWPHGEGPDLGLFTGQQPFVKGTVLTAVDSPCAGSTEGSTAVCRDLTIRLSTGPDAGQTIELEGASSGGLAAKDGDKAVLGFTDQDGSRVYYLADFNRDVPIAVLFIVFVVASLALGRWGGLRALAALVLSLLALVWFVIPSILRGSSPIAVAIVGAAFIMLVVLYVTGGVNTQTTVGVLGTMLGLGLIGALAWGFVVASHFTGLGDENGVYLQAAAATINLQGLLLGGIIIGSLGVLDDMTITQVSAVWELRRANPALGARSLYTAAERIGRDHISSTVNTLVLAYAGASLPLMILFTQSHLPLGQILTTEVIAVEVVRTLVGSIGLIASVPITTAIAAYVVTRRVGVETPADTAPPVRRWLRGLGRGDGSRDGSSQPAVSRPGREWRPPRRERDFWHDPDD